MISSLSYYFFLFCLPNCLGSHSASRRSESLCVLCSGPRYNLSSILCGVHSWPAERSSSMKRYRTHCVRSKMNREKKKGWLACIMPKSPKGNKEELMTMTEGIFPFLIHLLVFLPHLTLQRATSIARAQRTT